MDGTLTNFALLVSSFNPWYIVSIAIAIIAIDVFLINSETFLWVGIALFLIAFFNAINIHPLLQLWSYPVALFAVFVAQRYIGQILYRTPDPYRDLETYIGQSGRLRIKTSVTDNAAHFHNVPSLKVLDSMSGEKETELQESITVVKIEFTDGKIFPAKLKDISKFKDGDMVVVNSVLDQQFLIE